LLRSVKYGLYGAVLAGVVGGTVAWGSVDKTVTLVVDGHAGHLRTTASRVSDVLDVAGYHLGRHDLIAPAAQAPVHDGSKVIYKRGRLLHLDVNGVRRDVWTTAPTVAQALGELGYSTSSFSSVSRAQRLPLDPTAITVRTPQLISVVHDGRTERVSTTDATVGRVLSDLGIALGPKDRVSIRTTAAVKAGQKIVITRVKKGTVTGLKAVPYPTTKVPDATLLVGVTKVVKPGKDGLARVTYAVVYVNGRIVGKTPLHTVVVKAPTPRVVNVGTKPKTPPAVPVTPGSAQAIGKQLAAARGWGDDQFSCLQQLWGHESGWRTNAANPSGAYGIPQALPGSKMASAGPNWQTDATTQITWGLGYIAARYTNPCGAWSFWQANGYY
jgi:resuscitation-promoting factor RpfB